MTVPIYTPRLDLLRFPVTKSVAAVQWRCSVSQAYQRLYYAQKAGYLFSIKTPIGRLYTLTEPGLLMVSNFL
jgi:DNA-binding PadR family transcriptional regulator